MFSFPWWWRIAAYIWCHLIIKSQFLSLFDITVCKEGYPRKIGVQCLYPYGINIQVWVALKQKCTNSQKCTSIFLTATDNDWQKLLGYLSNTRNYMCFNTEVWKNTATLFKMHCCYTLFHSAPIHFGNFVLVKFLCFLFSTFVVLISILVPLMFVTINQVMAVYIWSIKEMPPPIPLVFSYAHSVKTYFVFISLQSN